MSRRRPEALASAYRLHGSAVHALALRLSGDGQVAEDVTTEVFVGIWHTPEAINVDVSGLRWFLLAECYRHVSAKLGRRFQERSPAGLIEMPPLVLDPAVHRTIELALVGGQTYRQIAATLGEPEAVVLHGLRSGLAQARAVMADSGLLDSAASHP